jgi:hypothetical protein
MATQEFTQIAPAEMSAPMDEENSAPRVDPLFAASLLQEVANAPDPVVTFDASDSDNEELNDEDEDMERLNEMERAVIALERNPTDLDLTQKVMRYYNQHINILTTTDAQYFKNRDLGDPVPNVGNIHAVLYRFDNVAKASVSDFRRSLNFTLEYISRTDEGKVFNEKYVDCGGYLQHSFDQKDVVYPEIDLGFLKDTTEVENEPCYYVEWKDYWVEYRDDRAFNEALRDAQLDVWVAKLKKAKKDYEGLQSKFKEAERDYEAFKSKLKRARDECDTILDKIKCY